MASLSSLAFESQDSIVSKVLSMRPYTMIMTKTGDRKNFISLLCVAVKVNVKFYRDNPTSIRIFKELCANRKIWKRENRTSIECIKCAPFILEQILRYTLGLDDTKPSIDCEDLVSLWIAEQIVFENDTQWTPDVHDTDTPGMLHCEALSEVTGRYFDPSILAGMPT